MAVAVSAITRPLRGVAPPEPPLSQVGSWQLVRCLGEGNWAAVYEARPLNAACTEAGDYAIKILRPNRQDDFVAVETLRREVVVAHAVSHPHLTTVLTWHLSRPPRYLVMPRLQGTTVRALLDGNPLVPTVPTHVAEHSQSPVSVPQSLWIVRQATEALHSLHAAGWIHGDVKPSNLFVSPQGHATLIDLGFAKRFDGESQNGFDNQEFAIAASPAYAAPEVLNGRRGHAPANDVYSLGITLLEMVTGQLPFVDRSPEDLIAERLESQPRNPTKLSPSLWPRLARLIRRMIDREPAWRPPIPELRDVLVRLEIETLIEIFSPLPLRERGRG